MPVDDIQAENERNPGPGFQGDFLASFQDGGVSGAINAAQESLSQQSGILVLFRHPFRGDEARGGMKVQLANLLFESHLGHQVVNKTIHS